MNINGSSRFRHRKTPSIDRFLSAYPQQKTDTATATSKNEENELNEDDIFSTGDFSEASNNLHHHHNSPPSTTSSPRHNQLHSHTHKAFPQLESFGILAALPEHKTNSHHHLYQKTALSSPSSSTSSSSTTSSSRFIPSIPKPPQDRVPVSASFSSSKFHQPQSAPVNVPVLSMAMRRRHREFEEIDEDEEEGDGEMLPPHEIVARVQSPMLACSVLEGVGRTLKGRDLRQIKEIQRTCVIFKVKSSNLMSYWMLGMMKNDWEYPIILFIKT
ncbi:hypothetical protein P3X46_000029 [Hevea brasiliensis]|uniref:Uncharacterized protein n=1 Tax=Hevea brasiliensis TaxID=3981 RepID=A0ABQ9N8P8_HEVBR|nr:protein S40-7 [Hevea brasiliensis]KAJ9188654.1 hypothetical protein P3X46_000029 [Hevea brasiliensis]